jgi:hypothetical protein
MRVNSSSTEQPMRVRFSQGVALFVVRVLFSDGHALLELERAHTMIEPTSHNCWQWLVAGSGFRCRRKQAALVPLALAPFSV